MTDRRFKKANRSNIMTLYEIYDSDPARYYFERVGSDPPEPGDISKNAYKLQLDSGEIQEVEG